MKRCELSSDSILISLHKWLLESGISPTTAWRYRRRGWLETVNINGRAYVSGRAIREFIHRAEAGEFFKEPAGCAGANSQARAQKETSK
jgi:hypothetical protein